MEEDESLLEMAIQDPQVTSTDAAERKLARHLRISKRIETARRLISFSQHIISNRSKFGILLLTSTFCKTEISEQILKETKMWIF